MLHSALPAKESIAIQFGRVTSSVSLRHMGEAPNTSFGAIIMPYLFSLQVPQNIRWNFGFPTLYAYKMPQVQENVAGQHGFMTCFPELGIAAIEHVEDCQVTSAPR
jgi:hypothetical protein